MSFNFRLPNITATSPEGKLQQMQSFLYQTVEQLNWALNAIETGTSSSQAANQNSMTGGSEEKQDSAASFNEIKSLIIKSADIVNAYYEKINARLAGEYVAQSDFGIFTELTEQRLEASSTAIEQFYTDLQQILTDIENVEHTLIEVTGSFSQGGFVETTMADLSVVTKWIGGGS